MSTPFSYAEAFSRNIGWVSEAEQHLLRGKRVAVAGLGGVGGEHLLALTRLGIGAFSIADFDHFDVVNFNRQAGASVQTTGKAKIEVMTAQALDINPTIDVRSFPEGILANNLQAFLADVDLYVDGLDFFAFAARRAVFSACHALGIPAITVAPLGMGAASLAFLPGGMTFEEYFRLDGHSESEMAVRFLVGLSPTMLQRGYLIDPESVDLRARRGPSTVMACKLCAGIAATEALKILLERGSVTAVPRGLHFDAFRNRYSRTWRPWGNRHPLQLVSIAIAKSQIGKMGSAIIEVHRKSGTESPLYRILDIARWAPSGDNTQPWRFEVRSDVEFLIRGRDTRTHCVYDLDGRPSQLALGALIENIVIAASSLGMIAQVSRLDDAPEESPVFRVTLERGKPTEVDPLAAAIVKRTVQRRGLSSRRLSDVDKRVLGTALGQDHELLWFESFSERLRMARLMFDNALLRLTMPEAYEVHRDVIQWDARFSRDRVPDQAIGLDPLTLKLTRIVMRSWKRVCFANKYMAGTLLPRIELDLFPSLACAGHFVIVSRTAPKTLDDYLAGGRAMQRVWLAATKIGLQVQPEMTPLIFARYVREERQFTESPHLYRKAEHLSLRLAELTGQGYLPRAVFMGRIGRGRGAASRSLRLSLDQLIVSRSTSATSGTNESDDAVS